MKSPSVNINFCRRVYLPKGNYNVSSLLTNRSIFKEDVWKDIQNYVKTQPNLEYRKLTRSERFTFVHLPNIEIKKMYLQNLFAQKKKIM